VITTSLEKEQDIQIKLPIDNTPEEPEEGTAQTETTNMPLKPTETVSLTELLLNKNDNAILVLGSEAFGISTNLEEIANYNVYIPPLLNKEMVNKHPFDLIDSLNVGVSAGILINHIKSLLKV
jgi:tRNA G18 (ribose-2'-O)-methylase SpoU